MPSHTPTALRHATLSPDAAALHLTATGNLDGTFGVGGVFMYNLGFDDFASGSAVFSGSRLYVTGAAVNKSAERRRSYFRRLLTPPKQLVVPVTGGAHAIADPSRVLGASAYADCRPLM